MVAIKALTVLALAGAISAAPTATVGEALERRQWNWGGNGGQGAPSWKWRWSWGQGQGQDQGQGSSDYSSDASQSNASPAAQPSSSWSPPTSSQPDSSSSDDSGSSQPSSAAPASSSSGSDSSSSGGSSDSGYMAIVNQWRATIQRPALTEDSTLQANAQKTADQSGGQLKHELNPGSMAQVLAPGNANNFESVFVGGWLCELPSLPGLGSAVCNSASQGWDHDGQTGHAEILDSTTYTKIGCALGDGIWACDLA